MRTTRMPLKGDIKTFILLFKIHYIYATFLPILPLNKMLNYKKKMNCYIGFNFMHTNWSLESKTHKIWESTGEALYSDDAFCSYHMLRRFNIIKFTAPFTSVNFPYFEFPFYSPLSTLTSLSLYLSLTSSSSLEFFFLFFIASKLWSKSYNYYPISPSN